MNYDINDLTEALENLDPACDFNRFMDFNESIELLFGITYSDDKKHIEASLHLENNEGSVVYSFDLDGSFEHVYVIS